MLTEQLANREQHAIRAECNLLSGTHCTDPVRCIRYSLTNPFVWLLFAGLYNKIPQMNNFVVYEGFFSSKQNGSDIDGRRMHITAR